MNDKAKCRLLRRRLITSILKIQDTLAAHECPTDADLELCRIVDEMKRTLEVTRNEGGGLI